MIHRKVDEERLVHPAHIGEVGALDDGTVVVFVTVAGLPHQGAVTFTCADEVDALIECLEAAKKKRWG